jgi:AbrB family looped-hinge helix DNA binding protein
VSDRGSMTRIIRSLRGGQITIPAEFRKRLGISGEGLLQVTLAGDELRLKPIRIAEQATGSGWLRELYDQFEPVRAEIEERGISESEVNEDIDAAVCAVREQRA